MLRWPIGFSSTDAEHVTYIFIGVGSFFFMPGQPNVEMFQTACIVTGPVTNTKAMTA